MTLVFSFKPLRLPQFLLRRLSGLQRPKHDDSLRAGVYRVLNVDIT